MLQVKAVCGLSKGAGVNHFVLPLLPQSTTEGLLPSSPMGRQQHQCLKIPIIAAVDTAPLPWCHLGILPLDSLSLDEHVDLQALKWSTAGCQIYAPFHFQVHQFFGPESSPQYEFFLLN